MAFATAAVTPLWYVAVRNFREMLLALSKGFDFDGVFLPIVF